MYVHAFRRGEQIKNKLILSHMLSEKPYLIWGVLKLFLHVFSRPEDFCLTRSRAILAHFLSKKIAIQIMIIGSKPSRSNRVSH